MEASLADSFINQMQKQFEKREGINELNMDMRGDGLDFFAILSKEMPLSFCCRGTRYRHFPDDTYVMEAGDGTQLPIDEQEFRSRLEYALSCIGASSEAGVSVLVKKHIKTN